MPGSRRFSTVLFDIDGTLIDSNGAHVESWVRSLKEHGIAADAAQIRPLVGMGGDKLLPRVAGVSDTSAQGRAIAGRKKDIFATLLPGLQPTAGARKLLEWLRDRGTDLVIATSADDQEMRALLEQAGVADLIPKRASKDDAKESKPDPDVVHAALERSRAQPETSVMVGDTPYDIEAAHRAGIGAIALRCGGHWSDTDLREALEIHDDPGVLLSAWRES
jgi:HAD superfamily hydrolase (TIGR01509 family)